MPRRNQGREKSSSGRRTVTLTGNLRYLDKPHRAFAVTDDPIHNGSLNDDDDVDSDGDEDNKE